MKTNRIYVIIASIIAILIITALSIYLLTPGIPSLEYSNVIFNNIKPNNIVTNGKEIVFTSEGSINTTENGSIKTIAKFPARATANPSLHAGYYYIYDDTKFSIYKLTSPQLVSQVNTTYYQWISNDSYFYVRQPVAVDGTDYDTQPSLGVIQNLSANTIITINKPNIYAKFFDYSNNILLFAQYNGVEQNSPIIKQDLSTNTSTTTFSPYSIDQVAKSTGYIYNIKNTPQAAGKYYRVNNNNLEELNSSLNWQLSDFIDSTTIITIKTEKDKQYLELFNLQTNKTSKLANLKGNTMNYSQLLFADGNIYLVNDSNFYIYNISELIK